MSDDIRTQCLNLADLPTATRKFVDEAFSDVQCSLSIDKKARILQMIMQCSLDNLVTLTESSEDRVSVSLYDGSRETTFATSAMHLLSRIQHSGADFCLPTLRQRLLCMELAILYHKEVMKVSAMMAQGRVRRKRAYAQGEKLDSLPDSGKSAKTRVLDSILQGLDPKEPSTRKVRDRLYTYVRIGSNLDYLAHALGFGILLILPVSTTQPCDFHLMFTFSERDYAHQPLEPSE